MIFHPRGWTHPDLKDLHKECLNLSNRVRQLPASIKAVTAIVVAFAVLFIYCLSNGFNQSFNHSIIRPFNRIK